jgi:hypothetical protein
MTKEEILTELSTSRAAIAREYVTVRAELDFKTKFDNLVRRRPYAWLSGAAALGWFLAGPKTKTRIVTKVVKPDGAPIVVKERKKGRVGLVALLLGVLKFAFPVVRPALTAYVGRFFADMATKLPK